MRYLPASLHRLRWKLTLSYTLVTVAALFVVELAVVVVALVALRTQVGEPAQLSAALPALSASIGRQARPYLSREPPDVVGLRRALDQARGNLGTALDSDRPDAALAERTLVVLVFDPDGRLLATLPDLARSLPLGEPLDPEVIPGLAPRLAAALTGQTGGNLAAPSPDERRIYVGPVLGDDGRVVGAVALIVRPDALASLTQPILPAGLSAIGLSLAVFLVIAGIAGSLFGFVTARGLSRRIGRLAMAATTWSRGDFSAWVEDRATDELGQLARTLNGMAQQLQNLLVVRQEIAGLRERERIARDLHDSVKQQVFATAMQLAAARSLLESDPAAATRHLSEAELLTRQAQRELSSLIQALRSADLASRGVAAALEAYAHDWSRQTGIALQASVEPTEAPPDVEQALYRIAQEALANVGRHSGARRARLALRRVGDDLHLSVEDDGRGFDPATAAPGVGLGSMRERVEALGGRIEVVSQPGQGTSVTASCPLVGAHSEVPSEVPTWPRR